MSAERSGAIADAVAKAGDINLSFEFFPPKTPELEEQLWRAMRRLETLSPRFVSVTYGAGGSTRDRTHRIVSRIAQETAMAPAAHLTCVNATRDEIDEVLRNYWAAGIRHIVALRGDPPNGVGTAYEPHPDGYAFASDLIAGAAKVAPFEISCACYPEQHPDSGGWDVEIDNLKRKLDAGAVRAISNFFFDAAVFLRFRDRLADAGVCAPVSPGIMPVTNFAGAKRMAAMSGATIPDWFAKLFDGLDKDPQTRQLVAAGQAAELCAQLANEGVRDFHFYTLNRAELTIAICRMLGVKTPAPTVEEAA